jgi:hypothetical protein
MKVDFCVLAAVSVGGCAAVDACGVVVQGVASVVTAVTHRGGTTIGAYAVGGSGTPAAGGVVITGNCEDSSDPNATVAKDEMISCAPSSDDGACASCLKGSCCSESYAWIDGSDMHGIELVACVNEHCAAACPVSP